MTEVTGPATTVAGPAACYFSFFADAMQLLQQTQTVLPLFVLTLIAFARETFAFMIGQVTIAVFQPFFVECFVVACFSAKAAPLIERASARVRSDVVRVMVRDAFYARVMSGCGRSASASELPERRHDFSQGASSSSSEATRSRSCCAAWP